MEREGAPVDPIGGAANATRSEIALPDGAVIELERYTAGYVDGYLRDGREMIREACLRRQRIQAQLPE